MNAIGYRQWNDLSSVVIKQYPDSINIINAGGFPSGVSKDNLLTLDKVRQGISTDLFEESVEKLQREGLIKSLSAADKKYVLGDLYYEITKQPAYIKEYRLRDLQIVAGCFEKAGISFAVVSREKYDGKDTANAIFRKLQGNSLQIQSVEKKEVNQEPPLLYDLTTLQKEANSKHGFSADKTLSIAQKLYEAKLTTCPRTGSRYISTNVFDEIPELIDSLKTHPRFGAYASNMDNSVLNIRSVDDKKNYRPPCVINH